MSATLETSPVKVAAAPGGKQLDYPVVATAMTKTVSAEPDLSKRGDRLCADGSGY